MPKLIRPLCLSFFLAACASGPTPRVPAQASVPAPGAELSAELKLFDPAATYPADRPDGSTPAYYGWAACFTPQFNRAPIKLEGSSLSEPCRPDTLYSWQADRAVQGLESATSGVRWKDSFPQGAIYTHINPVATYAYGYNALRFKLKPGTKFKIFQPDAGETTDYCGKGLSPTERLDTVAVRVFYGGTDYILCSPGPIESWSRDSKTHFDEIVTSAFWYFQQAAKHDWIPYRNFFPAEPGEAPAPLFISEEEGRDFDGHSFTEDQLAIQLKFLRERAGLGKIVYTPGVKADPRRHFTTAKPIYWNQRAASPTEEQPAAAGLQTFRDPSCGFRIDYPADQFTANTTSGEEFSASAKNGRATFNVSCEKAGRQSLKDLYRARVEGDRAVTYKTINEAKGFYIASGKRGQMIFYEKSVVAKGTLKTLFFTYEEAAKAEFDAAVTLVSKSFASEP